jgi:hypothetical protein
LLPNDSAGCFSQAKDESYIFMPRNITSFKLMKQIYVKTTLIINRGRNCKVLQSCFGCRFLSQSEYLATVTCARGSAVKLMLHYYLLA